MGTSRGNRRHRYTNPTSTNPTNQANPADPDDPADSTGRTTGSLNSPVVSARQKALSRWQDNSAALEHLLTDPGPDPNDLPHGAVTATPHTQDAGARVRALEEQLAAHVPDALDPDTVTAALESFLDGNTLVPVRHAKQLRNDGVTDHAALDRARELDQLHARAWAPSTLANYGAAVRAWINWCAAQTPPAPPLPLDPTLITYHLLDYAFEWNGTRIRRDHDGNLVARISPGTVNVRIAGLNKLATFAGLPKPGDHPAVAEVLRGIRREVGTRPTRQRKPLDQERLRRVLAAAAGSDFLTARDHALRLLASRTDATNGQLARLRWADITFTTTNPATDPTPGSDATAESVADGQRDGGGGRADDVATDAQADEVTAASMVLAPSSRYRAPRTVTVARHPRPEVCLIEALQRLRALSPRLGYVLTHPDGNPMSRQWVHKTTARLRPPRWAELSPSAKETALLRTVTATTTADVTPLAAARDRAVLLTGFFTARRRNEISALNWSDLDDLGPDGIGVLIRRSKTDQEGRGTRLWLPVSPNPDKVPCPARAIRTYRRELTAALGRPPRQTEPVFAALTPAGKLGPARTRGHAYQRLSGASINDLVVRLAVAAGLQTGSGTSYGGHSLRVGFVTEALRDNKLTIKQAMEISGHTTPEMLLRYVREDQDRLNNATRQLMDKMAALYDDGNDVG